MTERVLLAVCIIAAGGVVSGPVQADADIIRQFYSKNTMNCSEPRQRDERVIDVECPYFLFISNAKVRFRDQLEDARVSVSGTCLVGGGFRERLLRNLGSPEDMAVNVKSTGKQIILVWGKGRVSLGKVVPKFGDFSYLRMTWRDKTDRWPCFFERRFVSKTKSAVRKTIEDFWKLRGLREILK